MKPPTIEQLRILANRAARGPLNHAEVARMHAGIDRLVRPRRSATAARWGLKIANLRRRLHALHAPMVRGGMQICTSCSGWNGVRCLGLVTEWPCPTLDAFDRTFPIKETAA